MQLDKVNIGSWQNYQSFSDQEQIRLPDVAVKPLALAMGI